jgi:cyclic pyranopterin monophosphate synthase
MSDLTHIDESGAAHMVDIADKAESKRLAVAQGRITMKAATLKQIIAGDMPKGDVIGTARIAGIMAAKRTHDLIPLCHPLPISKVKVDIEPDGENCLVITATVGVSGKTGVEMEALTAVSVAGLTLYDMAKAVDKDMVISDIKVLHKSGGKSGTYDRD